MPPDDPSEYSGVTVRPDRPVPPWANLPDEELLAVRMCDLDLSIEGSSLEDRVAELYQELSNRQITFRPHFWLSDEWFTPDGVSGVAIPFYMAHPRLAKLELSQMLEVEGGTPSWCLRILRHEAGHAIDNAFDLRKRTRRRRLFGPPSAPYPEYYLPKPYSKSFVLHLDSWYAQSHPDEDFAETFAVWLTPESEWRERYAGWPALKKLEYIDALMHEIAGARPRYASRRQVDPLRRLKKTLRQHYDAKREHYGLEHPHFYDRDLRRLFSDAPEHAHNMPAHRFIARVRKDIRRMIAGWTGEYQYTIDQVFDEMIDRSRQLKLRLKSAEDRTKLDFLVLLTVQVMNYLHSGRHRTAL
jgi:hypothetical protein